MPTIYTLSDKKIDGATPLYLLKYGFRDIDTDFSKYDTLLITSRNSIKALRVNADIEKIAHKKLFCIGEGSYKEAVEAGFVDVELIESSSGDEFAIKVAPRLKKRVAILLRPKKVVSQIKATLKGMDIEIDELVVYETECVKSSFKIERGSVIIFSSPSTIECFFKNHPWREDLKAVVIGKKSAQAMPKEIEFELAPRNSLAECVKIAKKILDGR